VGYSRLYLGYSMKAKLILILALLVFVSGCGVGKHGGRIKLLDSDGAIISQAEVEVDRQASLTLADGDKSVTFDSRGDSTWGTFLKGMMQIVTLGIIAD